MAKFLFLLVFGLGALLHVNTLQFGAMPEFLHSNYEHNHNVRRPQVITRERESYDEPKVNHRYRRDTVPIGKINENFQPDIKPKINYLNDTHAQLMVHWLGEGSQVMICLARDFPAQTEESSKRTLNPSAVYFSYDYGDSFINKTDNFKVLINGTERPSTLDQFSTHAKFDTIIFTDSKNKAIFNVQNKGTGPFKRFMLDFTPSDVSFYESDANTYLVLDKEDPERRLYITTDGGETFNMLQIYVKSFMWSSGDDMPTHLYIERKEPTGASSVIYYNAVDLIKHGKASEYSKLIDNVQDFHIKKDFMIGVRKNGNITQVFVAYKRRPFVKALIQTVQEMKGIHICDVEGRRIMMAIAHSETSANLYVSESNPNMTSIKFVPSLENVFTYIPKVTWKNGWIASSTNEAFTDVYKVEGITGIYIASKITRTPFDAVGPEHLVSVITFDHGGYWQPLKAPEVDDDNQTINCANCTLHVSQKFSNLYPVTRSVQMMSSKLAPGIVMASGVVGNTLKGYPGVFLSRDGGMSWKQILKSYHFFNFGDHGGVLVAVKYFKTKGETRNILFSTDEGETWRNQSFHTNDLKIYGLMTEPNSNQTIFTLFGSEQREHRWLIVKVDLINAFERNCTKDDYKFWAPSSKSGESLKPCILGTQQAFQRRIHETNCYNGINYDRPVRTEVCVCTQWDFECDFGFGRQGSGTKSNCIFNKSMGPLVKPFEVPEDCKPGEYYNRTRGYRRIEGDVCIGGFEYRYLPQTIPCPVKEESSFILVAQRHKISRVDLTTNVRDTLPVQNLKNVIAIDFDIKNNCLFFADIMSDVIGRQCLDGNRTLEVLIDRDLASVEGMSYDWVSEMLFFVDGTRSLIEAVVTKPGAMYRSRVTIIDKEHLLKPRGIVVHPTEGYIFWTDWSSQKPSLSRSNLDGSDARILFSKPDVVWPNGITIDHVAQRVYWVDANKDYIASCDLNGHNKIIVVQQDARVDHPFAVGVFKDQIYWDDWKMNSIFEANKDHGIMIHAIQEQMENLMDLKVFAHSIQEGSNACAKSNCSHICVGAPRGEFSCLCPNGMVKSNHTNECVCPGGQKAFANLTCPSEQSTCGTGYFSCTKSPGICVPTVFRCDGEFDCEDKSDEENCPIITAENPCKPNHFLCTTNKKCIPQQFVCDMESDCPDGSDEKGCTPDKCKPEEFLCDNGNCISQRWKCDGENDCNDNSDEKNCPNKDNKALGNGTVVCKVNEFKCKTSDQCISNDWHCDRDHDCPDGSDELDCKNRECDSWEFSCNDGKCIYKTWWCDGDIDCEGGVDEKNCTTKPPKPVTPPSEGSFFPSSVCHDWMFKCANNKCIPTWWKCDKVNDCGDNSDEQGCSISNNSDKDINVIDSTTRSTAKPSGSNCPVNQFECNSGGCIKKSYVCDGQDDCDDGEDEKNCSPKEDNCEATKNFRCENDRRKCLPLSKSCNGIRDCSDGSDEENCEHYKILKPDSNATCDSGFFACDNICHPLFEICDEKPNCNDRTDENNCSSIRRVYQITYMSVVEPTNPTSFLLAWEVSNVHFSNPLNTVFLEYLPSIQPMGDKWRNHTAWISDLKFLYKGLSPRTVYNVTAYTRIKGKPETETPPFIYKKATTAAGVPSKPTNPKVIQLNGTRVQVSWDAPEDTQGNIKYTVFYRPQAYSAGGLMAQRLKTDATKTIIDYDFKGNETYEFWIRANNNEQESPVSQMIKLTFNDTINIDLIENLRLTISKEKNEVKVNWKRSVSAEGYYVEASFPEPYPRLEVRKTKDPEIVFKNMPKSILITFKVSAFVNNYVGRTHSKSTTLSGEPIPQVNNVRLVQTPESVNIQWDQPKTSMKNITYAIYYGTSANELFEKPRFKTQQLSADIKEMLPCENYLVSVGIWGPIGPGPLTHNPRSIETEANDKKPPRNLNAYVNPKTRYMIITWEHNCPGTQKYPLYVVKITENSTKKVNLIQLNRSSNKTMSHYIEDIPLGSSYNVSVRSNLVGSDESSVLVNAPPLLGPRQLTVWWEQNKTVAIFWREIENPVYNFNFTYEIVIYKGMWPAEVPHDAKIHKVIEAAAPPISVGGQNFYNEDVALDEAFTIGVRVKDLKHGYISEISEVEHIVIHPDYLAFEEKRTSAAVPLILSMLILCSIGGAGYFLYQKRRRQQASFSRFANSHYDTKTGATRIGDSLDDEETMHQVHERNQHRFSADEPLVT